MVIKSTLIRILTLLFFLSGVSSASAQDGVSNQIVSLVNQARASAGIPPVTMNGALFQAAQRHSNDMATTENLSHTGSDGSQFWQRISDAGYGMTTGGENVLYRWDASAAGAFGQWQASPPHNANMMSGDFLEIGVAYTQSASGAFYFTMVLASRPGITAQSLPPTAVPPTAVPPTAVPPTAVPPTAVPPTAVPPTAVPPTAVPPTVVPPTVVPPTRTLLPPSAIPSATTVAQLNTSRTQPTTISVIPTSTMRISASPTPTINNVVQSNSPLLASPTPTTLLPTITSPQIMTTTTLIPDTPSSQINEENSRQPTVVAMNNNDVNINPDNMTTQSLAPTFVEFYQLIIQLMQQLTVSQQTQQFAPIVPTVVPQNTVEPLPSIQPTMIISSPGLQLIYDGTSFTLMNISDSDINVSDILFESTSGSITAQSWNNEFLSQPLNRLTPQDCLQMGLATSGQPIKPIDCQFRHSWILIPQSQAFWLDSIVFSVRKGVDRLAICTSQDGRCTVSLDGDAAFTETTPRNSATDASLLVPDLRLEYDANTFTLTNVAGYALDLSGLRFTSTSGAMDVDRWNTEFLTSPLASFAAGGCLQLWSLGTDGFAPPISCQVRHAWVAVGDDFDFWRDSFEVWRGDERLAQCPITNNVCELSLSQSAISSTTNTTVVNNTSQNEPVQSIPSNTDAGSADIRLHLTGDSIALQNISGKEIDLQTIAFESDAGVFLALSWITPDLSRSLAQFPDQDCLQVWGAGQTWQDKPSACRFRHGWVAVSPEQQFWRDVNIFRVRSGATVLATCETRALTCDIDLP